MMSIHYVESLLQIENNMFKAIRYSLYIPLAFSLLILSGCNSEDPKKALKESLQNLVSAVEQKKHRTVTNKLTTDFRGNARLNQQTMSALIFRYYLTHKYIKIYTLINSIELSENHVDGINGEASAKMIFHAALTSTENALPEHMRVFKIESYWIKKEKDWLMATANWIEVRPQTIKLDLNRLIHNPAI